MQNIKHRKAQQSRTLKTYHDKSTLTSQIFIAMNKSDFIKETTIYDWRKHTEIPVVRATSYEVQGMKKEQTLVVTIRIESLQVRLSELKNVPLFKTIYLLKEALIGFERLIDIFGAFNVTSNMMAIDQNRKCKVWFNQDFSLNCPQFVSTEFSLKNFYEIFEEITLKTGINRIFFNNLKLCGNNFAQNLAWIDSYVNSEKIVVPNMFRRADERPQIPKIHRQLPKFISSRRQLNLSHNYVNSSLQRQRRQMDHLAKIAARTSELTAAESHQNLQKIFKNPENRFGSPHLLNVKSSNQIKSPSCFIDGKKESQKNQRSYETTQNTPQPKGPQHKFGFEKNNWEKYIRLNSARQVKQSIHNGEQVKQTEYGRQLVLLKKHGREVIVNESQKDYSDRDEYEEEETCMQKLQKHKSSSKNIYD